MNCCLRESVKNKETERSNEYLYKGALGVGWLQRKRLPVHNATQQSYQYLPMSHMAWSKTGQDWGFLYFNRPAIFVAISLFVTTNMGIQPASFFFKFDSGSFLYVKSGG